MDLSIIFILLTGLGLGLGHSLDPDHVVAVSTLVCNNKSLRKSIASATVWGIGHSAVLLVIGLLVLTLSVVIPQSVLKVFDCAAGVLLIILGVMVVRPLIAEKSALTRAQIMDITIHIRIHIHMLTSLTTNKNILTPVSYTHLRAHETDSYL